MILTLWIIENELTEWDTKNKIKCPYFLSDYYADKHGFIDIYIGF